jgi:hypothetical protein
MKQIVMLLIDVNGNIVASYNNKDFIQKLLPAIEAKLVTNIVQIKEVLLNPPLDLIGNENFTKTYTTEEFLRTLG